MGCGREIPKGRMGVYGIVGSFRGEERHKEGGRGTRGECGVFAKEELSLDENLVTLKMT